ncbi:MAG: HAD family phosphatase [Flammeovirgaceae bacterium]|mgnify:CR=1 FL=1|nr:HAD family phosphatase [Flammeovirgaceae bacterium]|tara:strand:+ start:19465 stop:20115 length:651 start_codon:yes stop_codon:yes gene_type:complete
MKKIGFIFDMDGVIVDNHLFHYQAWEALAKTYHLNLDSNDYRNHINGRTIGEIVKYIKKDATEKEIKKIGTEKEALYRKIYQPFLSPTKGLISLLNAANKHEIPMCIGTSAPKENVHFTINGLGLSHYFHTILDDRSVTKGKPNPEIYLKCANALGLRNDQCLVFEDAISGIKAGNLAGSKVVALATSHLRSELSADLIIDDFTQVTIAQLVNLIN